MDNVKMQECAICGDEKLPGQVWFLVAESRWEDKLKILEWRDELAKRRAAWRQPERRFERGYGWMFTKHIKQANEGCDFDFLETTFGKPVGEPSIF